ncbi:MAG: DMT family transporter [Sphingomonadales bacterium]|nr:DMT family transporter [Sphingomonadales bacterium]MBD3773401.1 DMT family transporter [Paracoccaceae bacterium]
MPIRSFLLLALVCLVWSANVVVSRVVVDTLQVPPLAYAAMRTLLVLAVLFPWLRPLPRDWLRVAIVTFAISGGSFALLFVGLRDATPSAAAIVSLSGAPLTVLFAILILRETIGWRRGFGIALTLVGVAVAIASPSGWKSSFGLIFVGASAVVGALGSVFLKRIDMASIRLQAWAALSSAVVLAPLSFAIESGQWAAIRAGGWELAAAVAFSALIVSVWAHTVYYHLLQRYEANLIAPLTLMTPIFTIAMGATITGDHVSLLMIVGAVIAASGVLVILIRPSRNYLKELLVRARL